MHKLKLIHTRVAVMLLLVICVVTTANSQKLERPKLVVGIVVDQMRYDFLYRYWDKYSDGGFKRLMREGFNFKNTHYNYAPTYTGPGHASIYTGTYPAIHGIVGNDWFVRGTDRNIYCTEDRGVTCIGADTDAGKMSPANLLTTTVTDELRLATNQGAKVIGVCLKDRGSILPAGHAANAAYWYDGSTGNWISSSFYMKELPKWVEQFNKKKLPAQYLNQDWETLLPLKQYTESTPDENTYEGAFKGQKKAVFPYKLKELRGNSYDLLRSTPFGNTFTKEFAIAAIEEEKMGKGNFTDFLTLSFSSTD
ncbi:MAG: alkaline phosphatase family protein, partial [Hymenobacteraceae bacterium]|nr:alkaline phosphatase family protein [Hymenobacteraceae bacterium]MDX5397885.1 alkaline phosphatase family protein [Hymenobacteraceae bacterium]MDX5513956.1 alkaline phosphatase family protein [Hymenobacteraceae bacterium]